MTGSKTGMFCGTHFIFYTPRSESSGHNFGLTVISVRFTHSLSLKFLCIYVIDQIEYKVIHITLHYAA